MTVHSGRLWLAPDTDSKLRVDIYLDGDRIRIRSNETVIGDWSLSEVEVKEIGNNRVRLLVEGEEVVVSSRDPQFMPSVIQPLIDGADPATFAGNMPKSEPSSFSAQEDQEPEAPSQWAALRSRLGMSRSDEPAPR